MRGWAQLPSHAAHVCSVSRDYTWPSVCKLCRNFANSYCALLWCLELSKYHLVVRFALHFVSFHPWLKVCVLGLWSEVVTLLDSSASPHLSFPIALSQTSPQSSQRLLSPHFRAIAVLIIFMQLLDIFWSSHIKNILCFLHLRIFWIALCSGLASEWAEGAVLVRPQTLSDSVWATQRRRGQTFPADWPCPGWSVFWTNVNKDILLGKNKWALSDHSISPPRDHSEPRNQLIFIQTPSYRIIKSLL